MRNKNKGINTEQAIISTKLKESAENEFLNSHAAAADVANMIEMRRVFGFKVSSLYIAQVKKKLGLPMGKNYNIGKENNHVPVCPHEKEEAIVEALRHFKMI